MEKRRFHELLEAHLRASGYTNYEFARITGINREYPAVSGRNEAAGSADL